MVCPPPHNGSMGMPRVDEDHKLYRIFVRDVAGMCAFTVHVGTRSRKTALFGARYLWLRSNKTSQRGKDESL